MVKTRSVQFIYKRDNFVWIHLLFIVLPLKIPGKHRIKPNMIEFNCKTTYIGQAPAGLKTLE